MTDLLVVAAHPDDEALGMGGTLARAGAEGKSCAILFLADGEGARGAATADAALRRRAAENAAKILGVAELEFADFPDNRFDTVAMLDLAQRIEATIARLQPKTVFTHHAGDLNLDHRRSCEAVLIACRPQPGHRVERILSFEVASSTEWSAPSLAPSFAPNVFVDIGAHLATKLAALDAYRGEMRDFPHPRSAEAIDALAKWRGATSGFIAAEAFQLLRERQP